MSSSILDTRLSDRAVAALQARYVAAVDASVAAALAERPDAGAVRAGLRDYLLTAARYGHSVKPAAAAELAQLSPQELQRRRRLLRDPLPASARAVARLAGWMRSDASRYAAVFGRAQRLYFPLPRAPDSPAQRAVAEALQQGGYSIADYAGGYATDAAGKQRFRIGKLLNAISPGLAAMFQNDTSRSASAMAVCLSRDPQDLARMSTGRGWQSCASFGGTHYGQVKREIANGSLVAYLIAAEDPGITRPLARIVLKPYVDARGHVMLRAAPAYGLSDDRFKTAVTLLADALSAGAPSGRYRLKDGVYPDMLLTSVQRFDGRMSAEAFLTALDVPFTATPEGRIAVTQDLLAARRGLTELPDLSAVDFAGSVDLRGNRLTSLRGLPGAIGGDLRVDGNMLADLDGAPQRVGGHLSATGNRLVRLAGAPSHVGGDVDVSDNRLSDMAGAPAFIGGKALSYGNPVHAAAPRSASFQLRCALR